MPSETYDPIKQEQPYCSYPAARKPQPSRAEVWAMFAANVACGKWACDGCDCRAESVAREADAILSEYDKRWSENNAK